MAKERDVQRDYSIDLIKVFAIIIIVLFHYADHGQVDLLSSQFNASWFLLSIFKLGGGTGNALFILST